MKDIEFVLSLNPSPFTSGIGKATKGWKVFQEQIGTSTKGVRELDAGLAGIAGKFAGLFGGISATVFAKSIFDAGTKMDQLDKAFTTITGSAEAAKQELAFVRSTAEELGLEFTSTADAFKLLSAASRGTVLEGKATRDIFLAVSEASTALGMSTEETQGSLLAISQMISKGNVSAEELRGQLGERLPGAFQIAARAMGVTTQELDKLLQNGEVAAVDMLPKLAAELHKAFSKGAIDGADGPVAALNRFKNAWFDLRIAIGESGFMDLATGKIKDVTAAMNDPAMKETITDLASKFFTLSEAVLNFAVNHGEAAAKVAGGLVAMSALSRTIALLTGVWKGLNAAMVVMTGLQMIPYLSKLHVNLDMAKVSAMGLSGALGAAAGSTLGFLAGMNIGERIYKATEQAERDLRKLQLEIDATTAKFRQFAGFTPETKESMFAKSERELESYKKKLEGAYKYQAAIVQSLYIASRETNMWGSQTEGARQATVELAAAKGKLSEIEKAMNEYGVAAKVVHARAAIAAGSSATEQKQVTGKALDEMKKKYKDYADEVKKLQGEIANETRSLSEELRSMSRTGMSDVSAWKDQKKEAAEFEAAAKKAAEGAKAAFAAGNVETGKESFAVAVEYAQKAKTAYRELNTEVKSGDQIAISSGEALKTAMTGVERAGKLKADILTQQAQSISTAAAALNKETGGALLEDLKKSAPELAGQLEAVTKSIEGIKTKVKEEIVPVMRTITMPVKSWEESVLEMQGMFVQVTDEAGRLLDKTFADRTMQVYINQVQTKALGGVVHKLARGGKLSGYGGGDRVRALLEPGEFVVRKEAVARYGVGYLQALNAMSITNINTVKARIGGLIALANNSAHQRFQQGGLAAAPTPSETINLNLTLPGSTKPHPMVIGKEHIPQLIRAVDNYNRRRSSNR